MKRDKILIQNLSLYYTRHGKLNKSLSDISVPVAENSVCAFIGPSGCGKSSLLRCVNRMNDEIEGAKISGKILIDGEDIYDEACNIMMLRLRVGMVFQKPSPFPKSIYENVAFGPRIHGLFQGKSELNSIVEDSLIRAGLWDEVKDRLNDGAYTLSGGQQQRLCIARAIAVKPEVILMDEPCSALDPIATDIIENLIYQLKQKYTIIIVTHSMQQAARVSDSTAFFYKGNLVEFGETGKIFTNPQNSKTQDYLTGRKIEE